MSLKISKILYFVFIIFIIGLLMISLGLSNLKGDFIRPQMFLMFRVMLYFQQGLLFATLFAFIGYIITKIKLKQGKFTIAFILYFIVLAWFVLFVVWGLLRGQYGIEFTLSFVIATLADPESISGAGLSPYLIYSLFIIAGILVFLLSKLSISFLSFENSFHKKILLTMLVVLIPVHVAIRTYFTYHINRDQYAVMALDDYIPYSLKSELLIPGLRKKRIEIKNMQIKHNTDLYIKNITSKTKQNIPHKYNILWIVIDSLRYDIINSKTTPNIWAYRDEFQIRLTDNHFSGGNATQFGIFSMLTGLGAYNMRYFFDSGVKFPFLSLLANNNYIIRAGKKIYFNFRRMYRYLPENTVMPDVVESPFEVSDKAMTDSFLEFIKSKNNNFSFNFLTFDSTHWPYSYPPADKIYQPDEIQGHGVWVVQSENSLLNTFNRYKNACHFIDSQIGRILNDLKNRDGFKDTIIIISSDHGEEFQERGQITHTGVFNDYQAKVPLWIHLPQYNSEITKLPITTIHLDIIPTLLDYMGFENDILYTQGQSLLRKLKDRKIFIASEQGNFYPLYHAIVTQKYISRWWHGEDRFLFSGVQRRDGKPVKSREWLNEIQSNLRNASYLYNILPDITKPARKFSE